MRYYEALHRRLHRKYAVGSFVMGLAGTGAAISFIVTLAENIQVVIGLILAVVSVWMFVSGFSAKAAVAHSISVQCAELALEFRRLFDEARAGELAEDAARKERYKLVERMTNVTSKAGAAGLASDDRLITESYETAGKVMRLAHAT